MKWSCHAHTRHRAARLRNPWKTQLDHWSKQNRKTRRYMFTTYDPKDHKTLRRARKPRSTEILGRKKAVSVENILMNGFFVLQIMLRGSSNWVPSKAVLIMRSNILRLSQAVTLVWKQMTSQDVEVLQSITNKLILHNKAGLDANRSIVECCIWNWLQQHLKWMQPSKPLLCSETLISVRKRAS